MLWSDLRELKSILEIDPANTREDFKLWFLIEWASAWMEELLNRKDFTLKSRTEFYAGTGTAKLLLRSRPVYVSGLTVRIDEGGYYGSPSDAFADAALTYGEDYCLDLKEEGKPSRSGILVRLKTQWPKPSVRQRGLLTPFMGDSFGNIKIVYTAGYTVDDFPAQLRYACNMLVARMRYILPLGVELNSENYEERSLGILTSEKMKLLALIMPLVAPYRNWKW